jgi:hypothetical protein
MKTTLNVLACLAVLAFSALGQSAASGPARRTGFAASATFGPPPPFEVSPVIGAPYSGEEINEIVRTLADGTHVTRALPGVKVYRDSMGRTRTEQPMGPDGLIIIEILDPVAHAKYILDAQHKVAHRQELPAASADVPASRAVALHGTASSIGSTDAGGEGSRLLVRVAGDGTSRPQMTNEKLGTQMIEGVLTEGTRSTITWPVGAQGNDRPITATGETWMSPELHVVILSKGNDPRNGEQTHKVINLSRSEPDSSLFQPPPGYTVVDEKSEFTINWNPQ